MADFAATVRMAARTRSLEAGCFRMTACMMSPTTLQAKCGRRSSLEVRP